MSDKEKRHAVLDKFYAQHYGSMEPPSVVDGAVMDAIADRIVALEAAIERVRALHTPEIAGDTCPSGCQGTDALIEVRVGEWEWPPCPTLRALEGTP